MLKEDFIVILPLPHNYKSLIAGIGRSLKFSVKESIVNAQLVKNLRLKQLIGDP
jgi:hypothetical protein